MEVISLSKFFVSSMRSVEVQVWSDGNNAQRVYLTMTHLKDNNV